MGDAEWLARLKAFANSGVWPEGGNKPAPRQRKWYDLYQKIEKCPMQARRQTTLFGGSMACNCGFHVVKPANAPQSVASVSAPGATASAQQTFLRPPLSLSMFTKSRFGGSQSASLKPHLVARKSPSSSPPSPSSVSSPSTSSVRTSMPAPSSVSSPSPSSVSTAVNTILANESGGDEPATAAAASFWLPWEMSKTIPAVDDSGMAGMDRVDSFAECLVGLRNQLTMVLTNQQVSNSVALWQNLLDYDKQRVVFAARHQSRLDTGRFRSPKKRQEFTPGVESLKRHALTTTAPLAQWPDCCRLIEAIFVRLCVIHRSPRKRGTGTVSRWDLILEDYRKIRRRILSNGTVMQQTTLQLVDLSHTTLVQWHNKRVKREDNALVLQGLVLPSRLSVASDPLPPSNVRPQSAAPSNVPPPLPAPIPAPTTRKLTRKVVHNTCKKCGKFRTAETGHSQYKGVVYCPSVEALSKEQWLKDMRNKK
ncbi:Protein trichome birefringence-like 25 [Dissostichus eleginoides]|uniref:Protein trichome birefringence-like 25 n=1 Tax=Dissostichus eleginoides TaxID=100907 RepID=A0AAD9BLQ9_DISEL|nr:Protein trichome birefringence-like 25 [Dissostichus eleginoides]